MAEVKHKVTKNYQAKRCLTWWLIQNCTAALRW